MGPTEEREKTAEELEDEETEAPQQAETGPGILERIERETAPLQGGETFDTWLGPLPLRWLAAIGPFVAIAVVGYLLCWALLGTLGLLIGWIPAAAGGALVAREIGLRAESERVRVDPAPQ